MNKKIKKVFLFFSTIFLIYFLFDYVLFQSGNAEGDTKVTIVSFNVRNLYSVRSASQYVGAMKHNLDLMSLYEPDILLLQEHYEILGSFSDLELRETLGLKHYVFYRYGDGTSGHGMAIYSKFPIGDTQQIKLRPQWKDRSLGLAAIKINGRILNVGVVHFPNTDMYEDGKAELSEGKILNRKINAVFLLKEFFGKSIRATQAEHLIEVTKDLHNTPFVIGGDLNTVPFSRAWRFMHSTFFDGFSITSLFDGTRSISTGVEVKIDHFFHSKVIESVESKVGYKQGSDHRPIIMKIRF